MKMTLNQNGLLDFSIHASGIVQDNSLETAYLISLMSHRRADPDDELPFTDSNTLLPPDRRGYVGDILDEDGRLIGSKLWLLSRSIANEDTRRRALKYIEEALAWAIDDGYVLSHEITANWDIENPQRLNALILVTPIDGQPFSLNLTNILNAA